MISFKKDDTGKVSANFSFKELKCPCSNCTVQFISPELISKLEEVRKRYGKPIKINSGFRCPSHNQNIGGKVGSSHVSGLAADISPVLMTLDELDILYDICYDIFDNIGDGRNKKFIHVDVREPKKSGKRRWVY